YEIEHLTTYRYEIDEGEERENLHAVISIPRVSFILVFARVYSPSKRMLPHLLRLQGLELVAEQQRTG
ncbi:hypothetical protein Tco_0268523, partial [Tanacetum coccineum]